MLWLDELCGGILPQLVDTNSPTWDLAIHGPCRLHYPLREQKVFAERNPKSYTSSEVFLTHGLSYSWVDPFRYNIADLERGHGPPQFLGVRIDFLGSLIQPNSDLDTPQLACRQLNAISGFAICLDDLDLNITDAFWNTSFVADSAHLGDVLAGTWGI